jgi:hypothetical protein
MTLEGKQQSILIVDDLETFQDQTGINLSLNDLVLTYDWRLHHQLTNSGQPVEYIDKLCEATENHSNNHVLYEFLANWFYDQDGKDILNHDGVSFGRVMKMDVATDIFFSTRLFTCLSKLKTLNNLNLLVASTDLTIHSILNALNIEYKSLEVNKNRKSKAYYFPIHSWMDEKMGRQRLTKTVALAVINIRNKVVFLINHWLPRRSDFKRIYIHEYHPTKNIIKELSKNSNFQVHIGQTSLARGWWATLFRDIPIPYHRVRVTDHRIARSLAFEFLKANTHRLEIFNEVFFLSLKYELSRRLENSLPKYLRHANSMNRIVRSKRPDLFVLISDQGKQEIDRQLAQSAGIPTYLIINGLLTSDFSDESRYADWINCYSKSIKKCYYNDSANALALGDPRMDVYQKVSASSVGISMNKKVLITIGAAGFNHLDLNSYVAFEFDFIFQVLESIRIWTARGVAVEVKLLVRSYGYVDDYQRFTDDYFSELNVQIAQGTPIKDFLIGSDVYISFYSQTLLEASCMGISAIYHKADREIIQSPFDGNSGLRMTRTINELVEAIDDSDSNRVVFDSFKLRKNLEEFIGPLNGENVLNNLKFIKELVSRKEFE